MLIRPGFVLTAYASMIGAVVGAQEAPATDVTRSVRLPPGKNYTINFLAAADSKTTLRFTPHAGVVFAGFVHEKSDLSVADGKVSLKCPGLSPSHVQLKVSDEKGTVASADFSAKEAGHYGYAWTNNTRKPVDVEVNVHSTKPMQLTSTLGGEFAGPTKQKNR